MFYKLKKLSYMNELIYNLPSRKYWIKIHSERIRAIFRDILNQFENFFVSCLMKNGKKSIRINPRHQPESIRTRIDPS